MKASIKWRFIKRLYSLVWISLKILSGMVILCICPWLLERAGFSVQSVQVFFRCQFMNIIQSFNKTGIRILRICLSTWLSNGKDKWSCELGQQKEPGTLMRIKLMNMLLCSKFVNIYLFIYLLFEK